MKDGLLLKFSEKTREELIEEILRKEEIIEKQKKQLQELEDKILAFVDHWNEAAHPFNWTAKSFDTVLAKVHSTVQEAA